MDHVADDQLSQTTKTSYSQYGQGSTLERGNLFIKSQIGANEQLHDAYKLNRPYQSA